MGSSYRPPIIGSGASSTAPTCLNNLILRLFHKAANLYKPSNAHSASISCCRITFRSTYPSRLIIVEPAMECGLIAMSEVVCSAAICTIISIRCLVSRGNDDYDEPNIRCAWM
jgi:hypothetical protein